MEKNTNTPVSRVRPLTAGKKTSVGKAQRHVTHAQRVPATTTCRLQGGNLGEAQSTIALLGPWRHALSHHRDRHRQGTASSQDPRPLHDHTPLRKLPPQHSHGVTVSVCFPG